MANNKILTNNFENSSNILRADFDPLMNSLKVYFRSGGVYLYLDVERSVFNDFVASESAGKFFVANIKDDYEFQRSV
jgi:hypothetical protein